MHPNQENLRQFGNRVPNRATPGGSENARPPNNNIDRLMPQSSSADAYEPFRGSPLVDCNASHYSYNALGTNLSSFAQPPVQDWSYSLTNYSDSAYETASWRDPTKSSTGLPEPLNGPQIQENSFQFPPHTDFPTYLPFPDTTQFTEPPMSPSNWVPPKPQDLLPLEYPNDIPVPTNKRPMPTPNDTGDETEDRRGPKQLRVTSSHFIGATPKQERILQQFQADWEEDGHLPSEKELKALAVLTRLTSFQLAMWFGDKLRLAPKKVEEESHDRPLLHDSDVLEEIANYIRKASATDCSTSHSRKATGGKYKCTWGCGYSTDTRDDWVRHEEKKQPQKFWHCVSCQALRKQGERHEIFIAHRIDKFLPHADACHADEDRDLLRAKSQVPYNAPFIRRCKFRIGADGKQCNHPFRNWKERNDHYIQHFEDAMPDQPHPGNPGPFDDDDDDDDEDIGPKPTEKKNRCVVQRQLPAPGSGSRDRAASNNQNQNSSFGNKSYAIRTIPTMGNADKIYDATVNGNNETSVQRDLKRPSGIIDLGTKWLIHVETYNVTEANSECRYLALKYSATEGAKSECLESVQTLLRPSLPPIEQLPALFRKALSLTADMGFQYLWIDIFCGLKKGMGGADTVYKQANLILVVGHPSQCADQIWHFTCDYSHLGTVQSWAKQCVSFHHLQQLGHGAYSVVDKVELRPTLDTFARKILFRTNTKQKQRERYLHEIEIMQKFHHPHIARFVAAYYDGSAFNILMSPVADCDLRRFLAFPELFPEKRKYLPKWFMSLAEALAYMHDKHCRHKDIKPANILISGKTVLLTDFGTSLDFSTTQSTSTGGALMTPKYCAPEVAANGSRGRSADVFSLGCVFAEMITVDLGKSLEDLHNWLRIEEESPDRHSTYHGHLEELYLWLRMLASMRLDHVQKRVLRTSIRMLDENPLRRPTAVEITKALCPKKRCNGLDLNATCHCCPRQHESPTISECPALDITKKNSGTLIRPERREPQTEVIFLYKIVSWTGISGKATSIQAGFVILNQFVSSDFSQALQIQKKHWSKRQTMLLRKPWMHLLRMLVIHAFNCWIDMVRITSDNGHHLLGEELKQMIGLA